MIQQIQRRKLVSPPNPKNRKHFSKTTMRYLQAPLEPANLSMGHGAALTPPCLARAIEKINKQIHPKKGSHFKHETRGRTSAPDAEQLPDVPVVTSKHPTQISMAVLLIFNI